MAETRKKGILAIIIATLLFSTGGMLIKSVDMTGTGVAAFRGLFAGLVFLPFFEWRKIRFDRNFILLILTYGYLTFSYVNATKMTTAANAIILQCTAPLWLYVFYLISRRKKFVLSEFLPRLAVLAGTVVILADPSNRGGSNTLAMAGNILALSSGIAYAAVQFFMEKDYPMNDYTKIGIINLALAVFMLVFFNQQIDISHVSWSNWVILLFLGVFQLGLAYVFLFRGIRLVSAFESSIISLLEPILNPIFVFFFIGEVPSVYTIVGFGAILVGILLTMRGQDANSGVNNISYEEEVCTKLSKRKS